MSLLARKLILLERKLEMEEHLYKLGVVQSSFDSDLKNRVSNILEQIKIS